MKIPFNKPYMSGDFIRESRGLFGGENILRTLGPHYQACREMLKQQYEAEDVVLTPSCTAALELTAHVLGIQPGDEVILPSFTYVSTANAFVLRGAVPVLIDSCSDHPAMDVDEIEKRITSRTKAIVIVHYAGIGRDLEKLQRLKKKHRLYLVEDAAHAIGAEYRNKLLGTFGDVATISFHETKNISCGQGGALIIHNRRLADKANVFAQCGTNRQDFIRKKVNAYTWISAGSNYLLAEPLCAILHDQLTKAGAITEKRIALRDYYHKALQKLSGKIILPGPDPDSPGNGHIFYFFLRNRSRRDDLIRHLAEQGIGATFHYQPLHLSPFFRKTYPKLSLPASEKIAGTLIRLPMYYTLRRSEQDHVIRSVYSFFEK